MLQPLKGTRILELGDGIASAFAARVLSDLGAEVIRLEQPGEPTTRAGGFHTLAPRDVRDAFYGYLNHGKRRVALDARSREGAELARTLAERSEAIILDRSSAEVEGGFDPLDAGWRERPIVASLSFHGLDGPGTPEPGDPFVAEHSSGFAFHQASPVEDPSTTPPQHCADFESSLLVGLVAANSVVAAILGADRARPGVVLDVSAEDVLAYLLIEAFASWRDGTDVRDRRRQADERLTVAGGLIWLLECADGTIMISPREDHQWDRWIAVMGRPDWTNDARLCGDKLVRKDHALKLTELMNSWSRTQRTQEVFLKAQESKVACYPVSTPMDLLRNEQLRARQFFNRLRLTDGTEVPLPGLPFQMTSASGAKLERGVDVAVRTEEKSGDVAWADGETAVSRAAEGAYT